VRILFGDEVSQRRDVPNEIGDDRPAVPGFRLRYAEGNIRGREWIRGCYDYRGIAGE
jgi:hypothetical protein